MSKLVVKGTCHPLLKQTAQEMAGQVYEQLMKRNDWYRAWKARYQNMGPKMLERQFIKEAWGDLVPQARAILAGMLSGPYDESLKQSIYDALLADGPLRAGRGKAQQVMQ